MFLVITLAASRFPSYIKPATRHVEVRQQVEQVTKNRKRKFTPATIAKRESKAEGAIAIKQERRSQ
jgi:hypothetical protein